MWENGNYTLQLSANPFYRHEQIILASGRISGYLPMRFLRGSHGLTVRYETGGYLPLSGFRIEHTEDALFLMERTVRILHTSPEQLLQPERIFLRTDTIFYGGEQDDLRIAFLPRQACGAADPSLPSLPALPSLQAQPSLPVRPQQGALSPFHCELLIFLAQLKQNLQDPYQSHLLRLARELYYMHPDTAGLLRATGLLRRELDGLKSSGACYDHT